MQKDIRLNKISIAGIVTLLLLLVCIRIFQERLFYDPLLAFFKLEGKVLPHYDGFKLFLGLALRYALNSSISLGIIYLVFRDRPMISLTTLLYIALFIMLIAAFFIFLRSSNPNLLLLFYIRRFLIQPLFLILFLPAFYYQKKMA
jgi:exosortase F-associated protein